MNFVFALCHCFPLYYIAFPPAAFSGFRSCVWHPFFLQRYKIKQDFPRKNKILGKNTVDVSFRRNYACLGNSVAVWQNNILCYPNRFLFPINMSPRFLDFFKNSPFFIPFFSDFFKKELFLVSPFFIFFQKFFILHSSFFIFICTFVAESCKTGEKSKIIHIYNKV